MGVRGDRRGGRGWGGRGEGRGSWGRRMGEEGDLGGLTNLSGLLDMHPLAIILQQELVAAWGILQGNAVDGPGPKHSHSCCCLHTSHHITIHLWPHTALQAALHAAIHAALHSALHCISLSAYSLHCTALHCITCCTTQDYRLLYMLHYTLHYTGCTKYCITHCIIRCVTHSRTDYRAVASQ